MDRRRYLAAAGAASLTALAGCSLLPSEDPEDPPDDPEPETETETPTETPVDDEPDLTERFDTIVDLVDAGADPTGEERIDSLLVDEAGDDTLLRLPEGEYRIGNALFDGLSNFGLVGENARFVLDNTGRNMFLSFRDSEDLYVEGITADCTAENTAAWLDVQASAGTNVIRDYVVDGFGDVSNRTNGLTVKCAGSDTSLLFDRVDLSDGAENGAATFVFGREFTNSGLEPGTLTFRDCVMNGWGKEGLYASEHSGPLRVIGGEYANNAIVQVRVGGGDAPVESVVRDVTIRIDEVPSYMPQRNRVLRGIWLKEGDMATIENCEVEIADVERGDIQGGIVVHGQFGRATIRSTEVRSEHDSPAVFVRQPVDEFDPQWMPSMTELPEAWDVTLDDVTVETESAADGIFLKSRDGSTLQNVVVTQRGSGSGIRLQNSSEIDILGGEVIAQEYPIQIESRPGVDIEEIRIDGVDRIESMTLTGDLVDGSVDNPYVLGGGIVSDTDFGITQLDDGSLYGEEIVPESGS